MAKWTIFWKFGSLFRPIGDGEGEGETEAVQDFLNKDKDGWQRKGLCARPFEVVRMVKRTPVQRFDPPTLDIGQRIPDWPAERVNTRKGQMYLF